MMLWAINGISCYDRLSITDTPLCEVILMRIKSRVRKFVLNRIPQQTPEWISRGYILLAVLSLIVVFGGIALIPTIMSAVQEEKWMSFAVLAVAYTVIIIILLKKNLNYYVRSSILCFCIAIAGYVSISSMGLVSSARLWFLCSAVLASLLIDGKSAFVIFLISFAVFVGFGYSIDFAVELPSEPSNIVWIITSATFVLVNILVVGATYLIVSSLKKTEASLRENEKILNTTSQMAKIGGWKLYPETMEVVWTDEIYRMYEVPGSFRPKFEDIISFLNPEDQPVFRKAVQRAIDNRIPYDLELRFITAKGRNLYVRIKCNPVFHDDKVVKLQGFFQDVTESKHAQIALEAEKERLAVTLRSIGDGVITTDINGNIVLMNKVAEELTGWNQDEAQGKSLGSVFAIIHETTRKPCKNPVHGVLSTGNVIELENHTLLISREGTERIIADSGAPIKDRDNNIVGVVLVFRDMTEKERFLKITQNSQKLESLGVLAGGIAHDFNNLLGGVYGYIDMAGELSENKNISYYLSKAMSTINRARGLTQQLLTFSRGGAPVQKVQKVFPFVKETAQFALSGSNISCRYDVSQDLWACNFDKNQIGQVVDNIVINAKQAMPEGGTVEITARNTTLAEKEHPVLTKGSYVRISIKDNGIGIPSGMLTKIFDPFFTTKSEGHGLGLATCYSIINRHGGSIDVDSNLGEGSTFHVYLPAEIKAVPVSSVEQTGSRHKGIGTFLVMDDEEVMRETIGAMLESFGYSVVCKDNGKDAVDYFASELKENKLLSGMIFDLTVPGNMGGEEAVKEVRKIDTEIPVFVVSGYADGPVMKNPVEYGFTASICKPFRRTKLMEMLEKHMKPEPSDSERFQNGERNHD